MFRIFSFDKDHLLLATINMPFPTNQQKEEKSSLVQCPFIKGSDLRSPFLIKAAPMMPGQVSDILLPRSMNHIT